MTEPAGQQRALAALEKASAAGGIDRTTHELLRSKYVKAYEVLVQSLQNEAVHLQTLQDLTGELERTDAQLQEEGRKQAALSQQVVKLRAELGGRETDTVTLQDGLAKLANEETLLREERMLLEQDLERRKLDYAESLRPRIVQLEQAVKELREGISASQSAEETARTELELAQKQLNTLVSATTVLGDEVKKISADSQKAALLPEKYQRQAELVSQALGAARADQASRERVFTDIDQQCTALRDDILTRAAEVADTRKAISSLQQTDYTAGAKEVEALTKGLRVARSKLRQLLEVQGDLSVKAKAVAATRFADSLALEKLQKEEQQQEKRAARAKAILDRTDEAEAPLLQKIQEAREQIEAEEQKERELQLKLDYLRSAVQKATLSLAGEMAADDEGAERLSKAAAAGRQAQIQVIRAASEMREASSQIAAAQAARSAMSLRASALEGQLKQVLASLQVKDTEADRLAAELHGVELRMQEYTLMYEHLKTQKNRLARLSQEAKLAIGEVREKITVLQNEQEYLSEDSRKKTSLLQRQLMDTADAQAKAQQTRQQCLNQKFELGRLSEAIRSHLIEIDNLGGMIAAAEAAMLRLREDFVAVVEQRNYAGIQMVERNDELCLLYEKLHSQEAVLSDAEAYMNAREADIRTMNTMVGELEAEKRLLQTKLSTELPKLVQERERLLRELADAQEENEELLLEAKSETRIIDDSKRPGKGRDVKLDLRGVYDEVTRATAERRAQEGLDASGGQEEAGAAGVASRGASRVFLTSTGQPAATGSRTDGSAAGAGPATPTLRPPSQPLPRISASAAVPGSAPGSVAASAPGSAQSSRPGRTAASAASGSIPTPKRSGKNALTATWRMVGPTKGMDHESLLAKQQRIEGRMQTVRESLLEKYIFEEELDKLILQLRARVEENQRAVPPETITRLGDVRSEFRSVTRKLMATVSEVSMEQATILKLKEVVEQLEDAVVDARARIERGEPPTDEAEHEWLVEHQTELDTEMRKRIRREQMESQVPGAVPTRARQRFDSYLSVETGLPRPYGGAAPFAPPEPCPNVARYMRRPRPVEIEL